MLTACFTCDEIGGAHKNDCYNSEHHKRFTLSLVFFVHLDRFLCHFDHLLCHLERLLGLNPR